MGYNRAHQLNIDNQSPPEDFCDETWREACESVAKADAELTELLADDYTAGALHTAINGRTLSPLYKLQLTDLLRAVAEVQVTVRNRYDELIANGGRP